MLKHILLGAVVLDWVLYTVVMIYHMSGTHVLKLDDFFALSPVLFLSFFLLSPFFITTGTLILLRCNIHTTVNRLLWFMLVTAIVLALWMYWELFTVKPFYN